MIERTNVALGSTYLQAVQREVKEAEVKEAQVQEKNTQANNQDRLEEIKNQIQNGTYQIDIQKTSEKMALNLLNL